MPNVEKIIYDGIVWHRYPNAKRRTDRLYFFRTVPGGVQRLHRYVWEKAHGKIPKGAHIHHKDGNPANNSLENLECLTPKAHAQTHPFEGESLERQLAHLDRIRDATKVWHASEEGKKWHSEHARKNNFGYFDLPETKCANCGKVFKPKTNHDKYCSNACKSAARRKSGVDNVEKKCEWCGKPFISNKYAQIRFCGFTCRAYYIAKVKREKRLRLDS